PEHVGIALDVLADMLQHPKLDPEELEREKNVILEEIKEHEDTPEDLVHDVFAYTLWPRHPLGRSVLGSPEVIQALTREDLLGYLGRHYVPPRTIVAAAGNVRHDDLVAMVRQFFGEMAGEGASRQPEGLQSVNESILVAHPTEQVHFCMGTRGYGQLDEERYALSLLDTAIGGGMSSRLFQEGREKRGRCYPHGSYTASYREGGLFAVYAGTSQENLAEVQALARQEIEQVARHGLDEAELERAKNQIRGAVLLGLDSMSGRMTRVGK